MDQKADIEGQTEVTVSILGRQLSLLEHDLQWKSCCFLVHKGMVFFLAQLVLSVCLLAFCIFQLTNDSVPITEKQFYTGTMTFIFGVWLPSPRLK